MLCLFSAEVKVLQQRVFNVSEVNQLVKQLIEG